MVRERKGSRRLDNGAFLKLAIGIAVLSSAVAGCSGRRAPNEPESGFRVVQSSPADGATNVSRSLTFTITFSAPVDTSRLGFIAAPIPPGIDTSIVISTDLKTFSATVELEANTAYAVIFFTAQDVDGNPLDEPFVLSFTTGPSFPTATISGTVRFADASDPRGSIIGVLDRNPLELLSAEDPVAALMQALRAITIVTAETGEYTIRYVAPGTYWVAGTKDLNADGSLEPPTQDPIGIYPGIQAQSIAVSEGQQITGIDFVLTTL